MLGSEEERDFSAALKWGFPVFALVIIVGAMLIDQGIVGSESDKKELAQKETREVVAEFAVNEEEEGHHIITQHERYFLTKIIKGVKGD